MRITIASGELLMNVSHEIAFQVLRIQKFTGGLLSDATLDAIARDLARIPYQPEKGA